MDNQQPELVHYQRARFALQLRADCLYTESHFWLRRQDEQTWQIGLTKFGSRLLGETVDYGFEIEPQAPVAPGQLIGWVEGFKALFDILSVAEGRFLGANPALEQNITLINQDPQGAGWLYAVQGQPAPNCMDVGAYAKVLDEAIGRMVNSK